MNDIETAFSLGGRVALVTGGAVGIGSAISRLFAAAGAQVVFTYRAGSTSAEAVRATEEAVSDGRTAPNCALPLDVRSVSGVKECVQRVLEAYGRIDVLVNNAGTNIPQPALEVDETTWDTIVDTNLKGLFFCSQAAARAMVGQSERSGSYSIVNIASQMGLVGLAERAAYCASKGGVVNLTRALAVEFAELGIRVNAVAPTFIETPLSTPMLADEAFRRDVLVRMPMRKLGLPEDVAGAVLFLCSPAARLVTGHTLTVDGGWTAW